MVPEEIFAYGFPAKGAICASRRRPTATVSEFVVELPLALPSVAETIAASGPSSSRLVLIIEDNIDNGYTLAQLLELSGHRVISRRRYTFRDVLRGANLDPFPTVQIMFSGSALSPFGIDSGLPLKKIRIFLRAGIRISSHELLGRQLKRSLKIVRRPNPYCTSERAFNPDRLRGRRRNIGAGSVTQCNRYALDSFRCVPRPLVNKVCRE